MAINSRKWWGLYFKEKTIIMENIISNFSQVLQNSVPFLFVNFHLSNLSSLSSNTKNVFRLRFTCVNRCSFLTASIAATVAIIPARCWNHFKLLSMLIFAC